MTTRRGFLGALAALATSAMLPWKTKARPVVRKEITIPVGMEWKKGPQFIFLRVNYTKTGGYDATEIIGLKDPRNPKMGRRVHLINMGDGAIPVGMTITASVVSEIVVGNGIRQPMAICSYNKTVGSLDVAAYTANGWSA